jgi:hypothetical protein
MAQPTSNGSPYQFGVAVCASSTSPSASCRAVAGPGAAAARSAAGTRARHPGAARPGSLLRAQPGGVAGTAWRDSRAWSGHPPPSVECDDLARMADFPHGPDERADVYASGNLARPAAREWPEDHPLPVEQAHERAARRFGIADRCSRGTILSPWGVPGLASRLRILQARAKSALAGSTGNGLFLQKFRRGPCSRFTRSPCRRLRVRRDDRAA